MDKRSSLSSKITARLYASKESSVSRRNERACRRVSGESIFAVRGSKIAEFALPKNTAKVGLKRPASVTRTTLFNTLHSNVPPCPAGGKLDLS
jgi:hypothetical protein